MTKPREIILLRREQVKELYFFRKYPIRQISKTLNWSSSIIHHDIEDIREEFASQTAYGDLKKLFNGQMAEINNLINKAWKGYNEAENNTERKEALYQINQFRNELLNLFARYGLLKSEITEIDKQVIINIVQDADSLETNKKTADSLEVSSG